MYILDTLKRVGQFTTPAQVQTAKRTVLSRDVASTRLPSNRQTGQLPPNHSVTTSVSCGNTTVTSRTKGKVRYDRLPTGEVVASIVREEPPSSPPPVPPPTKYTTRRSASETGGKRGHSLESSSTLPEGYPINQSNVTAVVEEAHRATQSMRILLSSMREELRRAGGLGNDGSKWTAAQLTQRGNITHRLAIAYQSYRKSIHDIENVQFRSIDPTGSGGKSGVNSTTTAANSGAGGLRATTSDAIVLSSSSMDAADTGSESDQVIDLTN